MQSGRRAAFVARNHEKYMRYKMMGEKYGVKVK